MSNRKRRGQERRASVTDTGGGAGLVASCALPPLGRLFGGFIVTRASKPALGPGARGRQPEARASHVPAGGPRAPRAALARGRGRRAQVRRASCPGARYPRRPAREAQVEAREQLQAPPPAPNPGAVGAAPGEACRGRGQTRPGLRAEAPDTRLQVAGGTPWEAR